MTEIEHSGDDIVRALDHQGIRTKVAEALIGCGYYDDDPDRIFEIKTINLEDRIIELESGNQQKRKSLRAISNGYILENPERAKLAALIHNSKSPYLVAVDEARIKLRKVGIHDGAIPNEDVLPLAKAVEDNKSGRLPTPSERARIADLFCQYGLHRPLIILVENWRDIVRNSDKRVQGDIYIRLAYLYRQVGDLALALRCTDLIELPSTVAPLQSDQISILCTERAAILIDLYEKDQNEAQLKAARHYAGKSWSIRPSEHCSNVYNRLKKFEDKLADQRADISRHKQLERILDPHDIKARKSTFQTDEECDFPF